MKAAGRPRGVPLHTSGEAMLLKSMRAGHNRTSSYFCMKQGSGANKTGPADVRAPAAKAKETSRLHFYFDASLASDLSSFRRVFQAGEDDMPSTPRAE